MPHPSAEVESSAVVTDVFKLVAHLMQRTFDELSLMRELLVRGSGATDRLDAANLDRAEMWVVIKRLESGQEAIATRIGTMDTQEREILRYVTPLWVRIKKRVAGWRKWKL